MSLRKVRGGPPKDRDCQLYERHILEEGTQEHLAAEFGVTQQGAKQRRSGCRRMGFPARQVVQ
ncbi:MAG TPA: hypothetical protein VNH11_32195 [Pirellulales bacterium]|nr:hypothetical protein [Pirellulales bacterium]